MIHICMLDLDPECMITAVSMGSIHLRKSIILFIVMCGCETWSLTVREEKNENFLEQGAEENI
jgi:uncharacterized membrane protein